MGMPTSVALGEERQRGLLCARTPFSGLVCVSVSCVSGGEGGDSGECKSRATEEEQGSALTVRLRKCMRVGEGAPKTCEPKPKKGIRAGFVGKAGYRKMQSNCWCLNVGASSPLFFQDFEF